MKTSPLLGAICAGFFVCTLMAPRVVAADSLVAYWPLDDTAADVALAGSTDDSGTWVGSSAFGAGRFGNGIALDGTNFISVPASPDVDRSGGDASISVWFTVGAWTTSWQCLVAKGEGDRWRVARRSGDANNMAYAGGAPDIFGGFVNDGQWHHLVAVSEAGISTRLIVDGELVATGGGPGLGASASPVYIGNNPDASSRQWIGSIDEVGIFSTPLNFHQAKAIHGMAVHVDYQYTLAEVNGMIGVHADGPGGKGFVGDVSWEYVAADPVDGRFFVQLGEDGSGVAGSTGPAITVFAGSETLLPAGDPLTLSWNIGTDADTASIDQGIGDILPLTSGGAGQITLDPGPSTTTTYTLETSNVEGENSRQVTVEVTDLPIVDSYTASRTVVEPGSSVNLAWSVRNVTDLDLNGTDVTGTGDLVVTPAATTTYTLTATNGQGSVALEILVAVVIPGEPVITEFCADNIESLVDEDGASSDWIELSNLSATPALLSAYYLTDDPDELTKWQIPDQVMNPGTTLLVFASGKDRAVAGAELHANFSLRASGEYLALVKIEEGAPLILSEFSDFPRQFEDISYGVALDGASTGYFTTPTPGAVNGVVSVDYVRDTAFFPDRGFYDGPITVQIASSTTGAAFRYTLDGTEPSATHGTLYSGPIPISTTTTLRAVGFKDGYISTNIDAQTYIFLDDVIQQPDAPEGFPSSWGGTVADYGMDPDVVDDPLYSGTIKEDLKAIPSISLVMPVDSFFNASSGIYANPNGSGVAWERAGSMEIIYPDGAPGHQLNCGVRMQGGVGRNAQFLKHNFRLLFKREYGATKLDYPLFDAATEDAEGATDRFDTIILRGGFNNTWHRDSTSEETRAQYLRDQWMHDSQLAMGHASCHGTFFHLYLNGLYWGLYNAVERPNADFASSYYGGGKEDWDALNSYPRNVVDGTATAWQEAHAIAQAGVEDQAGYDALAEYVDMENLIDYMLLNFYGGNLDWDDHNWYAARLREPGAGYKFFSWDAERTMESVTGANRTGIGQDNKPSRLFERLKQNPEFRMRFADHAHKALFNGGVLTPTQTRARYQELANFVDRAIVGESARWGDSQRSTPYTRNGVWVTERDRLLNQYFPQRTAEVLSHLRGHNPRLYPSVDAPVFSQHGGHVASTTEVTMMTTTGLIYYTTDGSDPRLPGGGVNLSALTYEGGATSTTLVAAGSIWKYFDGGTDLGTAWRAPGYDDAGWGAGPAELGYGDGGESTTVSFGGNDGDKHITTYFRHQFTAANVEDFTSLTLEVMRDDGVVVYLNGNLLKSDNMPAVYDFDVPAAVSIGGGDESAFQSFSVPLSDLVNGTNTLAVEIHQVSGTSSDISFDLQLRGAESAALDPLFITETGSLKARSLSGGEWSALNDALFIVDAEVAGGSNLAITEIGYRPSSPTALEEESGPNARSDFEFLELTNIGPSDLDLTNVRFTDGIGFNFNDSLLGFILPAGRSVVIVNDLEGFPVRHPSVPASMIAGEFSGNLSDDGEHILLVASDGSVIRDFTYNDKHPWPEAADGDGMTLVLVDPLSNPDHGDPMNWRASVAAGGTPGGTDATTFDGVAGDDLDHDGLSALAEYALGSSDADGRDTPLPIGGLEILDAGSGEETFFTMQCRRNLAADDVEFTVEICEDLEHWRSGPGHVVLVRAMHNGDGTETVTYRSAMPFPSSAEFMRVRFTLK